MSKNLLSFVKMNGLGNDFVILDARERPLRIGTEEAGRLADRTRGIGCDQVIILEPSEEGDVFMRIRNHDGGEVDACGNAARCVAWIISQEQSKQMSVCSVH